MCVCEGHKILRSLDSKYFLTNESKKKSEQPVEFTNCEQAKPIDVVVIELVYVELQVQNQAHVGAGVWRNESIMWNQNKKKKKAKHKLIKTY